MRVLIFAQYFPPDLGGAATRAYNAAKGLQANGCQVTVVTAFPHYPHGEIPRKYKWKPFLYEHYQGLNIIRTFILPLESKGMINRVLLFATFILSSIFTLPLIREIDAIWAANPDLIVLVSALLFGRMKKVSVISNVDDLILQDLYDLDMSTEGSLISRLVESIARLLYSKVKALTPISPSYSQYLTQHYAVDRKKIHVIRGGVDTQTFRYHTHKKKSQTFTIIYSGSFSVAYDFFQVIQAAKYLESINNNIEFILQGKGELAHQIKSEISTNKIQNVKLIEKVFSREQVAELLSQADVLLLPLKDFGKPYLGISSKLYEYQASGKPIICCAEGQPAKHILHTQSGIIVQPGDYSSLAHAVQFLFQNPEIARKFGESGRRFVEQEVTIPVIGRKLMDAFDHSEKISSDVLLHTHVTDKPIPIEA